MNKYRKLNDDDFNYANASHNKANGSVINADNHHHHHHNDRNAIGVDFHDDVDVDGDGEDEDEEYSALFLDNNYSGNNHNRVNNNNLATNHNNNNNNNNISSQSNKNNFSAFPSKRSETKRIHSSHNRNRNGVPNVGFQTHNNRQQQQQQQQPQNFISSSTNTKHTTSTTTLVDVAAVNAAANVEESIMEVPLLHHNYNADDEDDDHYNNYDDEPVLRQRSSSKDCHCKQPGFAVNLKTKSAQEAKCKILLAITLCCIFMIIEFLGGLFAGSLAIMTDAAHLASDCISFVIGLVAIWLGSRKPDGRMSFGYKRMEVMGAIVSILGIWMLTATLLMMAIERIYSNDFDLDANTMMTISGIGILINIAMIFILHGSAILPAGFTHGHSHAGTHAHSHSHVHNDTQLTLTPPLPETDIAMCENGVPADTLSNGNLLKRHKKQRAPNMHTEKNLNLRAAMIHVIGDLVQSVGVFLAAVLIKFFPHAKFADPLCTILFSFIVIMTTARLFKESVTILLDAVPKGISLNELEMDLTHLDGVKAVHHLNVWQHTANFNVLMVHLVIDLLSDSNTVLDKATQLVRSPKYDIKHCTIQIERLAS